MNIYEKKSQMRKERQEQDALREKYGLTDENVVVKETSNTGKFLIKTMTNILKTLASVLVLVLASIGIITLIYPESRNLLFETIQNAFAGLF